MNYGVEMEITTLVNEYPDGKMDIKTKGKRIFKLSDPNNLSTENLYSEGDVEFQQVEEDSTFEERLLLLEQAQKLFKLIHFKNNLTPNDSFLSYKLAHNVGLSISMKYHLLCLPSEKDRINIILDHLNRTVPVIKEMELSKQRAKMNGHFKKFNKLDF